MCPGTAAGRLLTTWRPSTDRVLVGDAIGRQLGIARADALTLLIPTVAADGTPTPRNCAKVRVVGDFDAGGQEQDSALLLANIVDVRAMGAAASDMGLRLRYAMLLQAPA